MKFIQILILLIILFSAGCTEKNGTKNSFTSQNDTLHIETSKIKGDGLIPGGAYSLYLQDTSQIKDFKINYPTNIKSIKISRDVIDFKPFRYGNMLKNKSDNLKNFLDNYYPNKIDTSNIPSAKDNSICIMTGIQGEEKIFIVDENNNKDFRDDSVRPYRKMDWKAKPEPIKCLYFIYNGEKIVLDSGWVNLGTDINNDLSFHVAHHMEAQFSLDNNRYKIEFKNGLPYVRFCFENPILALVEHNDIIKDSLLNSEMRIIGEHLKLGESFYRFEDVTNDGRYLTLVKENDVSNKIGTQTGFIAPDFTCQSIEGDTIRLKDYKGEYLLITNITACWSPIMSYEYYKELAKKYGAKINILAVDNSQDFLEQNIKDLNLTGKFTIADENPSIKKNYRQDFCSRTCFLISPDGRIADKFEIKDWNAALIKHFK